ncbi:MAG: FliI/YscN family ATPase [Myxococcota bacterium]
MSPMAGMQLDLLGNRLSQTPLTQQMGRVTQVIGNVVEAELPVAPVGAAASIGDVPAEVIGFKERRVLLMPLDRLSGIRHGDRVTLHPVALSVPVGPGLIGRVIDPLGRVMDGHPLTDCPERRPLENDAPTPLQRQRIQHPMETGIRAIDGLLSLGQGQRVAIMAGSGVGKSTLLGMFARFTRADVNVVALVGERGREVREFIERDLGEEGMARSVVVVSTSDSSPVLQIKCVEAALTISEYFRDQGKRVLFMADSLTRAAMARRQIGLAAGEPPTTKGYTPSVFTMMPTLLERAGPGERGSITAVCTVLVEGDDLSDPVADTVRGIVDGHIVLSRELASHGHYPPIDVLASLSRTMPWTVSPDQMKAASTMRDLLATWRENEEIIRLGAYRRGSDAKVDVAMALKSKLDGFLRQDMSERAVFDETIAKMQAFAGEATVKPGRGTNRPRSGSRPSA